MVLPMGGLDMGGPPSQYILDQLPKLKIALWLNVLFVIVRLVAQSQSQSSDSGTYVLDGLFDLFPCLIGYFLFRDPQSLSSCLCLFLFVSFMQAINNAINSIVRISLFGGLSLICPIGDVHVVNGSLITCSIYVPMYTLALVSLFLVQMYLGVVSYKMMKSAATAAGPGPLGGFGDGLLGGGGGLTGAGNGGGGGGILGTGGGGHLGPTNTGLAGGPGPGGPGLAGGGGGSDEARAPGFNAFAGQGQRLGG